MWFGKMNDQRLGVWIFITCNGSEHLWSEPMVFLNNVKRKRKIFRSNWFPVMKISVLCDMEGIGFAAVGNLPGFSYIGSYFIVLVHSCKAGKDL